MRLQAVIGLQADATEGGAERRILIGHDEVAGHGEREAGAECVAFDRSHYRQAAARQHAHVAMPFEHRLAHCERRIVETRKIATRTELRTSMQHDGAQFRIVLQIGQRARELGAQCLAERIATPGLLEGDGDAAMALDEHGGLGHLVFPLMPLVTGAGAAFWSARGKFGSAGL
jgi:hypothetical protein